MKGLSLTFVAMLMAFVFSNCGGSSSSSETTTTTPSDLTDTEAVFPVDVSTASPLETGSSSSNSVSSFLTSGNLYETAISLERNTLEAILAGIDYEDCVFDPVLYSASTGNAECYGPTLTYVEHPDATTSGQADGYLPSGDLGIWTENVEGTDEACSAGQLNSRINGMNDRVNAAQQTAASMRCVIAVDETVELSSESTTDMTTAMNTFVDSVDSSSGLDGVSFDSASITHALDGADDVFTYTFVMNYDSDVDGLFTSDGDLEDIAVTLVHRSSTSSYQGRLTLEYPSTQVEGMNCQEEDSVVASSLLYERDSSEVITAEVRDTAFCGADSAQFVEGIVDNTSSCGGSVTVDCWAESFDLFIAEFDKETLAGNYVYVWSAGGTDSNTRTLSVNVEEANVAGTVGATAYFGYGPKMSESVLGNTLGMICNWAGPNAGGAAEHVVAEYVQKQTMTRTADGEFEATESLLAYAPVNDCEYSTLDGGFEGQNFQIDADLNGTVDVHQDYPNEMQAITLDADDNAVLDGFTLPTAPENF